MTQIFAQKALLPDGWADNVRLSVAGGQISRVQTDAKPTSEDITTDCLLPGLCNAHGHAFQRALAGWTEERSAAGQDNFWTWRERMYELASRMDAGRLRAVARQAYIEMVSRGYTSVAEFHYLHREPGAEAVNDVMFEAIRAAANDSGIRLNYVPVLYERAGFDRPEPEGSQRLFATGLQQFLAHHQRVSHLADARLSVSIGAHSIRAVSRESLRAIAAVAESTATPLHIHVAEQQREVEQSLAFNERRPVRWLLENFDVNDRWCLVHATHMDTEEVTAVAQSRAVVCLCPSTEANLGDGLFPLADFLARDGRIAIGSDSHISINPFEELRWLEYGQRLSTRTRNVVSTRDGHVGRELFERVLSGGAQACGMAETGIVDGGVADLLCLNGDDPMLVAHDDASRLDALVFSGYRLPIEAVMVGGEFQVVNGEYQGAEDARSNYADAVRAIAAERDAARKAQ